MGLAATILSESPDGLPTPSMTRPDSITAVARATVSIGTIAGAAADRPYTGKDME